MMAFFYGCRTIEEYNSLTKDKTPSEVEKNIEDKEIGEKIVNNSNSEMNGKLINSIETTGKRK